MYPTREDVRNQFLLMLNDPGGVLFDIAGQSNCFQPAFNEAYAALYNAFLLNQCPRIEFLVHPILPPLTYSITPAQLGIADFGDFIYLAERTYGSNDKFSDLNFVDRLTQRQPTDRLIEANWRNNTFYFTGATTVRELELKFDTSGTAPTDDDVEIAVDASLDFLANYAAGKAAPWKGYDELGKKYMEYAVGTRYDSGAQPGGALFRLIQPLVRSRQHVQMAVKPYSTTRRIVNRRGLPYVAAQVGTTGGGSTNTPIQFSSANGTITGTIDGINTVFWLTIGGVKAMIVYRNGLAETTNVNYTSINNQITFLPGSIPQVSDVLTAEAYLQ